MSGALQGEADISNIGTTKLLIKVEMGHLNKWGATTVLQYIANQTYMYYTS